MAFSKNTTIYKEYTEEKNFKKQQTYTQPPPSMFITRYSR